MGTETTMTKIAGFTLGPADQIPEDVLSFAAILLVDTLGVAAGATPMDAGRIARDTAAEMFGAPSGDGVPMLFDGRIVSAAGCVFAAASQIDNLDAHDGYNPTKGHIGCAVIPALVALSAKHPGMTGREALTSLVISYEIAARAAIALHDTVSDYHTSGAWNGLGVAAMGCRLAGATPDVLRQALGIAEYHGPRSQMMREIANPTMLHDGSGMGALVGIMASSMAMRGFQGAPALTVEADEVSSIWADLGTSWTLPLNYIKPYLICRWAHGALDALRSLLLAHEFGPDDVQHITVRTFAESAELFPGMPDTTSKAQYSLAFSVATMLQFGCVGVEHISGDALNSARTAALIEKFTIEEEPRHSSRFPQGRWSDVTVVLTDGRTLVSGDVNARGGPEAPMDISEIREKFNGLCAPVLSSERTAALWDAGMDLTREGVLFADLTELVSPPPDRRV